MKRIPAAVVVWVGSLVALALAQEPPQTTFRAGIDVIQLDVSVLDKNRHPVRGLTAADFTVFENGKPQRIVATSEVDAEANDPQPTAWMRHVPHDVASNDLVDQLGDGRAFAVFMNDATFPVDSPPLAMKARAAARYVVDQIGPSDLAAVVFPIDAGRTQDFTGDREKLHDAIDHFDPHLPIVDPSDGRFGLPGSQLDPSQRLSYAMTGPECFVRSPIAALDALVTRFSNIPNRRKTLVFIGITAPSIAPGRSACDAARAEAMKEVLRKAQRGNVNIYSVDPSGSQGVTDYLRDKNARRGGSPGPVSGAGRVPGPTASARQTESEGDRRHNLQVMADETGGRAVVADDRIDPAIDRIFEEDGSYYLVGYQTSNGKPDGGFRKVEVKVNRSGLTARTRSGYWAPTSDRAVSVHEEASMETDIGATGWTRFGLARPERLSLRASVVPIARVTASGGSRDTEVAVVLTARLPPLTRPTSETLVVIRTVYDADGRAGTPARETTTLPLTPSSGSELRYDVWSRLTLPPGRYQIRFNAHSAVLDKSGSVYADVEVPDFARSSISMSDIALGAKPPDQPARADVLAAIVPIVPTTARDFSANEHISAFVRVFQGGASAPGPVKIAVQILDVRDAAVLDTVETLASAVFDASRGAGFQVELPLARLQHGPYLLSLTATASTGTTVRRDLMFRVR